MENSDVTKTRVLDLCVSCEVCKAACPEDAITMELKFGQFLPEVNKSKCTGCGLCLEICPGIDIDPFGLRNQIISDIMFDGPWLRIFTAHSTDLDIRKNSSSGGLITSLIIELIKNKEYDVAFVLPFDTFKGKPVRLKATNEITEIFNSAKSKYIPASVYNVIKILKERSNPRFIIVGTPCQVNGIKKYIRKENISEKGILFLGLFCEKTLNFNIIRYFEDTYARPNEKLIKFEFRTKEQYGWPGNPKAYFDSGRELIIDRTVRMFLKPVFQLKRCLFCTDRLNQLADISFGDCYVKGKNDFNGRSSIMIRTPKGEEIFSKYSYLFIVEKERIETIRKYQYLMAKKDHLEYIKIFIKKFNIYPDTVIDYEINNRAVKKLSRLEKYIKWGQNYNVNRIRWYLLLSKTEKNLKTLGRMIIRGAVLGSAVMKDLFSRSMKNKRVLYKLSKGNIVLVGFDLFNKGLQALTFVTVDQMKRRFPNKDIYLFSSGDYDRIDEEKDIYTFKILPWNLGIKLSLLNSLNILYRKISENDRSRLMEDHIKRVIKNTDLFVDISGFALSSQWGFAISVHYLLNILIAKKFSIPFYILPQSIGPFDYGPFQKIILYLLMKLYLQYPEKIFIREKEGLKWIYKFRKKDVEKSYDIVLTNKEYRLNNIYNKEVHFKNIEIEPDSVGIIPNIRVLERIGRDSLYLMFCSLIKRLINTKKTVYLLRHSSQDLGIIEIMKSFFPDNNSVRLISDDLNAIELQNLLKQFDFVVASRYHSIVHAYKNGVPALVIGWAIKYFDLLESFNQLDYCFDVRNNLNTDEIGIKLDKLIHNFKQERQKIVNKLTMLYKQNVFSIFGEDSH